AGLMGAGRTELAMSVFGRSYGTGISGRIYKHGREIRIRTVTDAIRHGIAYATEDRKTYRMHIIEEGGHKASAAAPRSRGGGGAGWQGPAGWTRAASTRSPSGTARR